MHLLQVVGVLLCYIRGTDQIACLCRHLQSALHAACLLLQALLLFAAGRATSADEPAFNWSPVGPH
jgi:hypothetical protein